MSPRHLRAPLVGAAAACLALTAAPAHASPGADPQPAVDLAKAYLASAKYVDENAAIRDGYVPDKYCVTDPEGSGGMGYHYIKESQMGSVDPAKPAALLYGAERGPDG
jgi:hypothetical protein